MKKRQPRTRVFIVDDHTLITKILCDLTESDPGFTVCGIARTGSEFLERAKSTEIDLLVLDYVLPDSNGFSVLHEFRKRFPSVPVLIISGDSSAPSCAAAVSNGAQGFLDKAEADEKYLSALRIVMEGGIFVNGEFNGPSHKKAEKSRALFQELTPKEKDVFFRLVTGMSPERISKELSISMQSFYSHKSRILKKFGCENLVQLTHFALECGLIGIQCRK